LRGAFLVLDMNKCPICGAQVEDTEKHNQEFDALHKYIEEKLALDKQDDIK